jgi:PAS domain S-box-containing protein
MSQQEEARIDREIHAAFSGSDPFAAAVRATRMPMLITDPNQPDNPIIFVNDAFFKLTGYTREETLGRNCRFLQGPATNAGDVNRIRQSIKDRVPIEIDLLNYRKDGTTFWNRLLISPVFDDGKVTHFFASQFDVTPERDKMQRLAEDRDTLEVEIQRRSSDLAASEDRLRFTLNAGGNLQGQFRARAYRHVHLSGQAQLHPSRRFPALGGGTAACPRRQWRIQYRI